MLNQISILNSQWLNILIFHCWYFVYILEFWTISNGLWSSCETWSKYECYNWIRKCIPNLEKLMFYTTNSRGIHRPRSRIFPAPVLCFCNPGDWARGGGFRMLRRAIIGCSVWWGVGRELVARCEGSRGNSQESTKGTKKRCFASHPLQQVGNVKLCVLEGCTACSSSVTVSS